MMKVILLLSALFSLALATQYNSHRSGYGHGYGRPRYGYRPRYYRCPKLSAPDNGNVEVTGLHPGSDATYTCNVGYDLIGDEARECQRNGQWTGSAPICQIVDCGQPDAADENGRLHVGPTTYLSTALYTCNQGFLVDVSDGGAANIVCQADGTWSDTAPGCTPVDCGELASPANGDVRYEDDTTFGSQAIYSCNRKYKLAGDMVRECQYTGIWSLAPATCEKILCPKLTAPANGKVRSSGQCVDDHAVYGCRYGYRRSHKERRVCQEDGTWSGTKPECEKVYRKYSYGHSKYSNRHHGGY